MRQQRTGGGSAKDTAASAAAGIENAALQCDDPVMFGMMKEILRNPTAAQGMLQDTLQTHARGKSDDAPQNEVVYDESDEEEAPPSPHLTHLTDGR